MGTRRKTLLMQVHMAHMALMVPVAQTPCNMQARTLHMDSNLSPARRSQLGRARVPATTAAPQPGTRTCVLCLIASEGLIWL